MKRLCLVFIALFIMSVTVVSLDAIAQSTPQGQPVKGTKVTFGKSDLLNAMPDDKRQEFLEMREKLRQLKKAKDSKGLDPAVQEASAMFFRTTAEKFERDFGMYRGFRNKTVTVYGNPLPSKTEIMKIVIGGRSPGSSGGMLYPHWNREEDSGAVVGSNAPPKIETAKKPDGRVFPEAESVTVPSRTFGDNGCTHGIFGIPDDTPECRAAMRRR